MIRIDKHFSCSRSPSNIFFPAILAKSAASKSSVIDKCNKMIPSVVMRARNSSTMKLNCPTGLIAKLLAKKFTVPKHIPRYTIINSTAGQRANILLPIWRVQSMVSFHARHIPFHTVFGSYERKEIIPPSATPEMMAKKSPIGCKRRRMQRTVMNPPATSEAAKLLVFICSELQPHVLCNS